MKTKEEIEKLAYAERRKYQDEQAEKNGGMNECIMIDAMKVERGYEAGYQACQELLILCLAGISTASLGYWKEGDEIHTDYDTVALRDVAKLYQKYDKLFKLNLEDKEKDIKVTAIKFVEWIEEWGSTQQNISKMLDEKYEIFKSELNEKI